MSLTEYKRAITEKRTDYFKVGGLYHKKRANPNYRPITASQGIPLTDSYLIFDRCLFLKRIIYG